MADLDFTRLSLLTQSTYAQLLDQLLASETGDLNAGTSLVSKRIRGRTYWYAQRRQAGKKIQTYLGPESPELEALVARARRARVAAANRAELVAMARAGGAYVVPAAEARVLELLTPVFRMGAVLVGSHAFAVLGNMLGVRWQELIVRTADIDLAHDHRIALALAEDVEPVHLQEALMDPLPRFSVLHPNEPATSFQVRGTEIQVDLLTPLIGRERKGPIRIPALRAAATPLRFLDYLIEETQPGAVLGGYGTLVNVPRPGRFALHKLIVASRRARGTSGITKSQKDRAQASALLRVLLSDLPGEITLAWKALSGRGKAWLQAISTSCRRLDPEIVSALASLGVRPPAHMS